MLDDLLRVVLEIHPPWLIQSQGRKRWRRSDLRKYQLFLIDLIKRCWDEIDALPGVLLALEPGAGKTATVLTAILDLIGMGKVKKVLIVASVLVAQTVWPDELDDWEHLKDMTWTLLRVEDDDVDTLAAGAAAYNEAFVRFEADFERTRAGVLGFLVEFGMAKKGIARTLARRIFGRPGDRAEPYRLAAIAAAKEAKLARLCAEDTQLHIINKEALLWLWNHYDKGKRWPYDVIVTDDLREGRSGRRRSIRGKDKTNIEGPAPLSRWGVLAAARKRVHAVIELTGTPTPKGLENLWGLMYLIDLGSRLGSSKTAFLNRWFHVDRERHITRAHRHSFDEIMGLIKDVMFSLDPKDLPQLPEFVVDPIRVRLPAKVLAEYKTFKRQMVSEEYDVEAVNGGVLHGKLLQFANGSMYQEDGNDIPIHDVKIEALKELVERLNGTPLLVAYTYQFDVDRICKAFPNAEVLRPENSRRVVKDWNADKIPLLICHRDSAAHGLNMQKGTGHMCEYGLTSDAELYEQFRKRIHRSGRNMVVFNHVIIAEGTIDEDIWPMYLEPRLAEQHRILESVRVQLKEDVLLTISSQ